ncbi:MAG TPA: hypothetical protein VFI31_00005, partial [Pirellulales bacterium]|nr:hypothetical protein [Pirellulales bacterium]
RTEERMQNEPRRVHMGERGVKLADFCFRLAGVDLPRAERIARDTEQQPLRVRGLGAIALRLAENDPPGARRLLASILREELPHPLVDDEFEPFGYPGLAPPLTAAWLLPVAERVDAQLGRECFWHSLALRPQRPRAGALDDQDAETDIRLAMMLSRYDRRAARDLLEPLIARLPEFGRPTLTGLKSRHAGAVTANCRSVERTLLAAVTHIDPHWAIELYDGLPPEEASTLVGFQVVEALVHTLSSHGADRWQDEDGFFHAFSANYWRPK